jgi:peptidylprolyl isomerase
MKFSLIIMALCAALAIGVAGCGGGSDSSTDSTDSGASTEAGESSTKSGESSKESAESVPKASPDEKKTKPTVTVPKGVPPTSFATKELEEGTGPEAKKGDEVTVEYVGVGYDSEKEFDSSWGKEPFPFTIGAGNVIQGWEQGVVGMKVGGRRELLIPGELAYGAEGSPPDIAPNETLIFVIDLLSVE